MVHPRFRRWHSRCAPLLARLILFIENLMTPEELKDRIIKIAAKADDDEAAHSAEDKLHQDIIRAFCPEWVIDDIKALNKVDFKRWCA